LKKTLKKALLLFNWFVVFSLLLAYLCVYISPERFWLLALFGLAYPILLILNIILIIFWLIRKTGWFLISLSVVLLGWGHFKSLVQFPKFKTENSSKEITDTLMMETGDHVPVTFLSYNVRLFDYYEWSEEPEAGPSIYNLIHEKSPGILCLQEIFTQTKGEIPSLYSPDEDALFNYAQTAYAPSSSQKRNYGIATLSVFPIIHKGEIRFPETHNLVIYSDLLIDEDTIRVYNNHLQSIKLDKKEYDLMRILNSGEEEAMSEIKNISYRIKDAFQKRAQQADRISSHIQASPYPVIVCGDFNDPPVSYTYRKIRKNLTDAYIRSGSGLGNTYSGLFPSYRIDYILHSKDLYSESFETNKVSYSDHYPISCLFKF
jgi:endonuclease/exonuclease/phosphatase family metal-dependent hydrolase